MLGPVPPVLAQATQAGYTVVFTIDRIGRNEVTLLGHREKKETINEAQQLLVVLDGNESICTHFFPQSLVSRVLQEAPAQDLYGLLYTVP